MDVPERNLAKQPNRGNIAVDKLNNTSAAIWVFHCFNNPCLLQFHYDPLIHFPLLKNKKLCKKCILKKMKDVFLFICLSLPRNILVMQCWGVGLVLSAGLLLQVAANW